MRFIILSLFYVYLVTGQDTLKDVLTMLRKEKLLHKIPSSDLSGLFTPPPGEKEVEMDFNMDSSETLIRHVRQADGNMTAHFERQDYDFMAPEGKSEKSAPLAVLTFLTPLDASEPVFTITEDPREWFEIGKIKKSQSNDTVKYRVAINQRAGVEIKYSESKNGIYWITVEVKQDSETIATVVRVDVLEMGPVVVKKTTSTGAPTTVSLETSTTQLAESSTTLSSETTTTDFEEPAEITTDSEGNFNFVTTEGTPVAKDTTVTQEATTLSTEEPSTQTEAPNTSKASESPTTSPDTTVSSTDSAFTQTETTESSTDLPVATTELSAGVLNMWVQDNNVTVESPSVTSGELSSSSSESPDLLVSRDEITLVLDKNLDNISSSTVSTVLPTEEATTKSPEVTTDGVETTEIPAITTVRTSEEESTSVEIQIISSEASKPTMTQETSSAEPTTLTTKIVSLVEDVIGTTTKNPKSEMTSIQAVVSEEPKVVQNVIVTSDKKETVLEEFTTVSQLSTANHEIEASTLENTVKAVEIQSVTETPVILTTIQISEQASSTEEPTTTVDSTTEEPASTEATSTKEPVEASTMLIGEFLVEKSGETVEGSGEVASAKTTATESEILTTSSEILTSVHTTTSEVSSGSDGDPLTDAVTVASRATTMVMASKEDSSESTHEIRKTTLPVLTSTEMDDPLTGAVTIATEIVQPELRLPVGEQEEDSSDLTLDIAGSPNDLFMVPFELRAGDLFRGLTVVPNWNHKTSDFIHLTVVPTDVVEIRPKFVESGGKAYFILKNGPIVGEVKIKVIAEFGDAKTSKTVTLRGSAADSTSPDKGGMKTVVLKIQENSPSGTTAGKIEGGNEYKVIGDSGRFALLSDSIILSCPDDVTSCIDREDQKIHQMMLIPKDVTGVSSPKQILIEVEDVNDNPSNLETTDEVIRIADSKLIMPFGAQIVDADESDEHKLMLEGSAADFIQMEKVGKGLYQAVTKGAVAAGRYELLLTASDGKHTDTKRIRVHAQNSKSKAHFRRPRYERIISADKVVQGDEFLRAELEGVPIDEAKFLILSGNPGWLTIDDYDGTLRFKKSNKAVQSGTFNTRVGAVDRSSGRLLAETVLVTKVEGGVEKKSKVLPKRFYEKTFDREEDADLSIALNVPAETVIQLSAPSFFALDENGQTVDFDANLVSITEDKVTVPKKSIENLRILRFDLESDGDRATIVFHFSSSDEYVMHRHRMETKPVFPEPWSEEKPTLELIIDEKLPVGHVVAVIPAFNPQDGNTVDVKLEDPTGSFRVDEKTGAISVARRLDHESMPEDMQLKLKVTSDSKNTINISFKTGEEGYETVANLKIRIRDIDDNSPVFTRDGLMGELVIPENLPGDSVIAKLQFTDADYSSHANGFKSAVLGSGENLFTTNVLNDTVVLSVRPNAVLDREIASLYSLVISVIDSAGHTDTVPITISLTDENDNSPVFDKEMYNIQAVENWPAGVILHRLRAEDSDQGERGRVNYHLMPTNAKYFSIDSLTGEFSISRDLIGLAREEPYLLTAVATDGGIPPRNSTTSIRVKINEPLSSAAESKIVFESPDIDFVLKLKEDIAVNEKVYQAKAKSANQAESHMHIRYSAKELNSDVEHFGIDESTGEIVLNQPLDYETEKDHVLLLTASHLFEPSNTTRILRIMIENVDDNEPKFPKSAPFTFTLRSDAPIGRLMASDADGDPFFYYLLPSCSPLTRFFTIEKEFGEISFTANDDTPDSHLTLCAIVSADHALDASKITYSEDRSDMAKFIVIKEQSTSNKMTEDVIRTNGSVTLLDPTLERVSVQVEDSMAANLSLQIDRVDYSPSETVPPLTKPNILPPLFSVDNSGNVRVSPQMSNQPEGVYKVVMNTNVEKETLTKEFHLIEDAHKMQFIFNEPVEKLSQYLDNLKNELTTALRTDRPEADFSIQFALPRQDKNISRSSICFHIVRDGMILSPHTTMTTISQTAAVEATKLAQAYQKHAVVNIEPCLALLPSSHHPSADSAPYDDVIPMSTLVLISSVAFLAFLLFVLFVYLCFVRRYKTYLQKKERNLKVRNCSPPPLAPSPTFMLAPSQLTPPLGYWEA